MTKTNWVLYFDDYYQNISKELDKISEKLKEIDLKNLDPGEIISILTGTYPFRQFIKYRPTFIKQAEEILIKELGAERTERLLKNRR